MSDSFDTPYFDMMLQFFMILDLVVDIILGNKKKGGIQRFVPYPFKN